MSLSDKITQLGAELDQRQKAQRARALLQNLRSVVLETNTGIQDIVDGGSFATLDTDVKAALIAGWDVSKATETALDDAIIAELLDWRP